MSERVDSKQKTPVKVRPLARSLIVGTGWTIAIRWTSKFLGIISLAVCARILTPEDYGLVNMAMVVVGLSQVLVEFGLDASLIRNQNANHQDYDTAWSLKILQSTAIALLVIICAPIAAKLTGDERVMPIMLIVGAAGLIGGFQNIYVVNFRKDMDFRRDFLFAFVPRFVSFAATIVTVVLLESYWGLVIGVCTAEVARLIFSYVLVRQRANWSLANWRSMTSFSLWYFLDGLAQYCLNQLDRLFVGSLSGAASAGIYGVAREIAALPSTELVLPIGRALVPALSKLNDEPARQVSAISQALSGVMLIACPIGIGSALVAPEVVVLLFGSNWLQAIPVLSILCVTGVTVGFRSTAQNVLLVVGRIQINAIYSWCQAIVVLGLLYPFYRSWGLSGIAWLYVLGGLGMSTAYGIKLWRLRLLSGSLVWLNMSRSILAALVMYLLVGAFAPHLPTTPLLSLLAKILFGALCYCLTVITLWLLMGKPHSGETVAWNIIQQRLGREPIAAEGD